MKLNSKYEIQGLKKYNKIVSAPCQNIIALRAKGESITDLIQIEIIEDPDGIQKEKLHMKYITSINSKIKVCI